MRSDYRPVAPAPDVAEVVSCRWTFVVGENRQRLIPDGCVDLLVLEGRGVVVCGPDTSSWRIELPPGTRAAGVRLRPGLAASVLGVPADEILDLRVTLDDLWGGAGGREAQRILDAGDTTSRAAALEDLVRRRHTDPAGFEAAVVDHLAVPRRDPVASLAADLGLSTRQLRRRCTAAFGFGPAFLARVLRFQQFLGRAHAEPFAGRLARLAAEAGYADQAHLARECRELTGVPPSALLAEQLVAAVEPQ